MKSEETNQGKITQHFVETVTSKVSSNGVRVSLRIVDLQLLVDVGFVHEGVEHIQHRVNIPNLKLFNIKFYINVRKRIDSENTHFLFWHFRDVNNRLISVWGKSTSWSQNKILLGNIQLNKIKLYFIIYLRIAF